MAKITRADRAGNIHFEPKSRRKARLRNVDSRLRSKMLDMRPQRKLKQKELDFFAQAC